MTKVVIIEDESHAGQALVSLLQQVSPSAQVLAVISTVQEGISYLSGQHDADLILSDVQLSDGLSFSIFQQVPLTAPVIFITGYNHFMMNAFACNSIDYLLKPVGEEDLQKALQKYQRLQQHFAVRQEGLAQILDQLHTKKRSRLVVKKGVEHISLPYCDVVLFYTENKLVYVVDRCGKKYLCDKNLAELEMELDREQFFRLNRQYIVNINYIRSFRSYERVKLQVELLQQDLQHILIVSQETAPEFRKWVAGDS
jgi:DNA-binding LytR/AlgR family response regulator